MEPTPTPASAGQAALEALAIAQALGSVEGRTIFHVPLNRALAPLRTIPAVGVRCGHCFRGVSWWAIDPAAAFVAVSQRRRPMAIRQGGVEDFHDPPPGGPASDGLAAWIRSAMSGRSNVSITDWRNPSGYPLRVTITCPGCSRVYPLKNTTRLHCFLTSVSQEAGTIGL